MRASWVALTAFGLFQLASLQTVPAQTVLQREPHYLARGAVVFVDTGQCGAGKVMKVTGLSKGISRRKACVTLDAKQATLRAAPSL